MVSPAKALRERLQAPGLAIAAGAHDALSARLVEETGFDAVWASGFGISAVNALPDANILTMTEGLSAARRMAEAVRIPVIADADTGFGNAVNVLRTVREYEHSGMAAICIEDNVFPKRCSFYEGVHRELVPLEEHARKIEAATAARRDPDFLVIARTEALIAGYGIEEALRRARAYAGAGADAILVHSKAPTFAELAAFGRGWDLPCPLVAVPTTYPNVTPEELLAAGFKMAIFANQPLRAAVHAMRSALRTMKKLGRPGPIEDQIATLEDIYALVGVPELEEAERRYLTSTTRAIIIAAGFDAALMPLIRDRPKSMLEVRGRTILERQVETLRRCGVGEIAVVRGYQKQSINLPGLRYFDNDRFQETGEIVSLFQAAEVMNGGFVFLYGDILFERTLLEKLLRSSADIAIVVDRAWPDIPPAERPPMPDLVITSAPPSSRHRFVADETGTRLIRIGRGIDRGEAHAEFVGMALFSERGARILTETYRQSRSSKGGFHEAPGTDHATMTDLLQEIVDRGHEVVCVETYKGWQEVDTFDDYRRAWSETHD